MYRLRWPAAGLFSVFMVSVIYAAHRGIDHPGMTLVRALPYGDKVGHVVLWGVLTAVLNLALSPRTVAVGGLVVPLGTAAVTLVVMIEEFSQGWLTNRTLDGADVAANLIGIGLATAIGPLLLPSEVDQPP